MVDMTENEDKRAVIKSKLRQNFDGKIVRKDLTKKIKEGANVPVYVLEFLLGQYCSSDDPDIIEEGVENVKRILADNFVRPDEAQKILSVLRQRGSYTVIDKITVNLNIKRDFYEAEFSNLGLKNIPIDEEYPAKFDRLLCGGIWCIVQLDYEYMEEDRNGTPISIRKLTPIQMPHVDIEELKQGRKAFTQDEWMDVLLRSIGMEPDTLTYREKWLLLIRMIPLVENNFNLCELGPRSTGKSHLYKEISPNSILVSGGQTTVANLFYNMGRKTVGLVGLWDCVAFDEVAGIRFKDKDGIQLQLRQLFQRGTGVNSEPLRTHLRLLRITGTAVKFHILLPRKKRQIVVHGDVAEPDNPKSYCVFHLCGHASFFITSSLDFSYIICYSNTKHNGRFGRKHRGFCCL